jgi:hypothetical protein
MGVKNNEVISAILSRRSIRKFIPDRQILDDD